MSFVTCNRPLRHPRLLAFWAKVASFWNKAAVHGKTRRLRLCESLPVGDKRSVVVIEFESERFLIGSTPSAVTLLARLGEGPQLSEVLTDWCERQR